jgi:hypothetical protein
VSLTPLTAGQILLYGGLAVGVLDIAKPLLFTAFRGGSPVRILQAIASGALGKEAFQGGYATALLGLGFHFFIALTVFATYYLASRLFRPLVNHALSLGACYGIAVYFFMQFVVFPLSAIGPVRHPPGVLMDGVLTHIFCVGLPTGFVVRLAAMRRAESELTQ